MKTFVMFALVVAGAMLARKPASTEKRETVSQSVQNPDSRDDSLADLDDQSEDVDEPAAARD